MRTALPLCLAVLCACGPGVEPPHVLYSTDAQSLDNPFPDARLLVNGSAQLRAEWYRPFVTKGVLTAKNKQLFDAYARDAVQLDGFNAFGPTLIRTSEPVDPATLAGHLARLRKAGAGWELLEADVAFEHSFDSLKGTGLEPPDGYPEFFMARPGVPLHETDEGLLVVTRGVKTAGGQELGRGFEWDHTKPALAPIAKALGVKEDDVLVALPQKPGAVMGAYQQLIAWTEANGRAQIIIPAKATVSTDEGQRPVGVWKSTDSDFSRLSWLPARNYTTGPSRIERVVMGELVLRDLRENGVWKREWIDDPSKAPLIHVPFVLTIPAGAKPAAGWPTVIGTHGINNRNTPVFGNDTAFCLELAELFASAGQACLGIDAPAHGARGNSISGFFTVGNMPAMRDTFREMTFDLLQVARTAPDIDVDGDGQGDLDPDLGLFGNSLGGIMGASAVSVSPRVTHSVLNVPGGGLSNILASDDIRDRLGLLLVAQTTIAFDSPEYFSVFPLFRTVGQTFLEAGDPINIAQALPLDHPVLLQEGVNDRTVPNFTTEGLAKVASVDTPAATVSGTAPVRALFRADPARWLAPDKVAAYNGHGVFWDFAPVRTQAMTFLHSRGRELPVP